MLENSDKKKRILYGIQLNIVKAQLRTQRMCCEVADSRYGVLLSKQHGVDRVMGEFCQE